MSKSDRGMEDQGIAQSEVESLESLYLQAVAEGLYLGLQPALLPGRVRERLTVFLARILDLEENQRKAIYIDCTLRVSSEFGPSPASETVYYDQEHNSLGEPLGCFRRYEHEEGYNKTVIVVRRRDDKELTTQGSVLDSLVPEFERKGNCEAVGSSFSYDEIAHTVSLVDYISKCRLAAIEVSRLESSENGSSVE